MTQFVVRLPFVGTLGIVLPQSPVWRVGHTPTNMGNNGTRARSYVFTLNNPIFSDYSLMDKLADVAKYLIFGVEVGEQGTEHFQGYVQFKAPRAFSTVKSLIPRAHIEVAKGSAEDNIKYCSKEGFQLEYGERPSPSTSAERDRFKIAWDLAVQGKIEEIDKDIAIRYYGTLKRLRDDFAPEPTSRTILNNFWLHGPTGSGKSSFIRKWAERNHRSLYIKNINKWWDGYVDQDLVLIEEWGPEVVVGLQQLLKVWADHYPFRAEVKGSSKMVRPPMIVITSNWQVHECFADPNILDPISRRFRSLAFPGDETSLSDLLEIPPTP